MQPPPRINQADPVVSARQDAALAAAELRRHRDRCGQCPLYGADIRLFCEAGYQLLKLKHLFDARVNDAIRLQAERAKWQEQLPI